MFVRRSYWEYSTTKRNCPVCHFPASHTFATKGETIDMEQNLSPKFEIRVCANCGVLFNSIEAKRKVGVTK